MATTDSPTIRILCVDDHPLVRKGLCSILNAEPGIEVVAEAANGREALEQFGLHLPDVTLMDIRMPEMDGIAAMKSIRADHPEARIIALTSFDGDQEIYRALEAGVRGYLLKEMVHTEVVHAIRLVHAGERLLPPELADRMGHSVTHLALTAREVEVLELVAQGLANKEIAAKLGTASGTIKMHVQNILDKLDATDRTHAVTMAIRRGIIRI
ncbi:MAG: response regulator transcription factor [Planctomycetota bacterium]|nr:response regulator transcription factor [Planctomycetota bacterium]